MFKKLGSSFFLIVIFPISSLIAQEYRWQVGFDYFFDNQEYAESSYAPAQTVKGIWVSPLGGVTWKSSASSNSLQAGLNILSIPGTKRAVDKVRTTLYYQYSSPNILFRAGSFPRKEVLGNYSSIFFSDSIQYFVPLMQGLFFQVGNDRHFLNAWMDWTGHATSDTRESFYLGFSGKTSRNIFFADFQSYLFHYAGTFPGNPNFGVSEQLQGVMSLGIELENREGFNGLLSTGIFAGIERDRQQDETYRPVGFIARADGELWGIGTTNTLYKGDARMRLFPAHGTNLYWGSPFLQGSSYLLSKWFIRLMESDRVGVQLNLNLHFSEGNTLFQQALTVSVLVDNEIGKNNSRMSFPWMRYFR